MNIKITSIVFISFILLCSCKSGSAENKESEKKQDTTAPGSSTVITNYDFTHPVKRWVLSDSLIEISGIVWLGNNKMMAIEDLHPLLYTLQLGDTAGTIINKVSFKETTKEKLDMEDMAIIGDTVYALWSHGAVFKIWNLDKNLQVKETKTWLKKENNTEGMAVDPVSGNLLIACKDESDIADDKKSTRSVFEFDVKADSLMATPFMLIHKKDFKELTGEKIEFYPSAIAVHPLTHDVYIMSTKDTKCIAQFSHDGKLKAFQYLDKDMFLQPEGICFDPQGNLYISTEGKHGVPPYIYEFAAKGN